MPDSETAPGPDHSQGTPDCPEGRRESKSHSITKRFPRCYIRSHLSESGEACIQRRLQAHGRTTAAESAEAGSSSAWCKFSNFMKAIIPEKWSVNCLICVIHLQWLRKESFPGERSGHLKTITLSPQGVQGAKAPGSNRFFISKNDSKYLKMN